MNLREKYKFTYPGHALVIACCIMEKYSSLEEARKPCIGRTGKKHDFPAALGDNEIPGAGGCVYSALEILGMDDVDAAIKRAHYCWGVERDSDRYDKGVEEAKELEPVFREMLAKWRQYDQ